MVGYFEDIMHIENLFVRIVQNLNLIFLKSMVGHQLIQQYFFVQSHNGQKIGRIQMKIFEQGCQLCNKYSPGIFDEKEIKKNIL